MNIFNKVYFPTTREIAVVKESDIFNQPLTVHDNYYGEVLISIKIKRSNFSIGVH